MTTIHGVLDISKIQAGAFDLKPAPLPLRSLVERHVEDVRVLARQKGLSLTSAIEEPEATVRFDEYCLSQALLNLLGNAVKFTEEGTITVRLCRAPEGELCLEIRDTGVGIDPGYLPRLFTPFSQELSGYTRPFEGSGLGLALARNYLALNGARISVESEKGRGSTFRVHFSRESEVA
jgi:signal transduction histidine kinase